MYHPLGNCKNETSTMTMSSTSNSWGRVREAIDIFDDVGLKHVDPANLVHFDTSNIERRLKY